MPTYDYDLPPDLIAQTPVEPRDAARLLVLRRAQGILAHHVFDELPALLRPGDVLVANDSRVLPARLYGRRARTGGAVEVLLLHRATTPSSDPGDVRQEEWIALVRPGKRIRPGEHLICGSGATEGALEATVEESLQGGERRLLLRAAPGIGTVRQAIGLVGTTPLPPYIHAPLADPERYQTIYARPEGSVAAPTAGLHITARTLDGLRARDITMRYVTLHVGAGTFKPMDGDDPTAHVMHAEWAELDAETARSLNTARAEGRRIVAVGTTSVRVLETAARALPAVSTPATLPLEAGACHHEDGSTDGPLQPYAGWTDIFIRPGHTFRAVDALITNFHLPRSTLLLLVSALAGKEAIDEAYAAAIAHRYRFYSFGDAMLIE